MITRLDGLTDALDHPTRTAADRQLRAALNRHVGRAGEGAPAVAAVRVACAHLAAGDLEWAYLSLLTARDQLGSGHDHGRAPARTRTVPSRSGSLTQAVHAGNAIDTGSGAVRTPS